MGFIKQNKVSGVAPRRSAPMRGVAASSSRNSIQARGAPNSNRGSAGDLAEMIEAIEDESWALAYAPSFVPRDYGKKMTAYCTFRPANG
jgi:hypothetical protein